MVDGRLKILSIAFTVCDLDSGHVLPVPVIAHQAGDEQFAAQGVFLGGGDGMMEQQRISRRLVNHAVQDVREHLALLAKRPVSVLVLCAVRLGPKDLGCRRDAIGTYHQISALLQCVLGEVGLVVLAIPPQNFPKMCVAPLNHDRDHQCLTALLALDGVMEFLHVLSYQIRVDPDRSPIGVVLIHALLLEGHQHRLLELVFLELCLHALGQAVGIFLVAEAGLDLADLVIRAAHECLDQQLAARLVALVPEIGPIGLTLPLAKRRSIACLHQGGVLVLQPRADVLSDIDAFALRAGLDQALVLDPKFHHLLLRQSRENLDQRLDLRCALLPLQRLGQSRGIVYRIVETCATGSPLIASLIVRPDRGDRFHDLGATVGGK